VRGLLKTGADWGVNCPQPAVVASLATQSTTAAPVLDPSEEFLVSFRRKSGASRGAADVLSGAS